MIDSLIAFRILYMLVTPFKESQAFKLGIIDEKGTLLKRMDDLRTMEEKDAYNMLHRLVFNLKRLLIKLPGGDAKLKNIAAAYFLVKENHTIDADYDALKEDLAKLLATDAVLVEETIAVMSFVEDMAAGGAPVNSTGPAVSTDEPVINKKRIHRFKRKNGVIIP